MRVLEAQNHSWIIEETAIHRWDGQQLQSWKDFKAGANELVGRSHTLWATTLGGWPIASACPAYQRQFHHRAFPEHGFPATGGRQGHFAFLQNRNPLRPFWWNRDRRY